MLNTERRVRYVAAIALLVISAGCATKKAFTIGEREMRRENYDAAVLAYSKAVAKEPGKSRYSLALERAKLKAAGEHFDKGRRFLESMQYEEAIAEFQQTLLMTPDFQHAQNEMSRALRELRRRDSLPSELEALKERARKRDRQDLRGHRQGRGDQLHLRREDRPRQADDHRHRQRHAGAGAGHPDAADQELLQADRRVHAARRAGHAAEAPGVRRPGDPHLLPQQRRHQAGRDAAALVAAGAADRGERRI